MVRSKFPHACLTDISTQYAHLAILVNGTTVHLLTQIRTPTLSSNLLSISLSSWISNPTYSLDILQRNRFSIPLISSSYVPTSKLPFYYHFPL